MEEDFEKAHFSLYFKGMLYTGIWVIETDDRVRRTLYFLYTQLVLFWMLFMIYMGILDFIYSVPDVGKMVFNACINVLVIGTLMKSTMTKNNSDRINDLRRRLHRNPATCKDAEECEMYEKSIKDTKYLVWFFTVSLVVFFPLWFLTSMLSVYTEEREYPLPARWLTDVDIDDPMVFYPISMFHAAFALFFLIGAISLDSSMYGLLAQMVREYRFLIKKIAEFGDYCEEVYTEDGVMGRGPKRKIKEINIHLMKQKVRQTLREIIKRQKELIDFTNTFEYCYNKSMFVHIFAGGGLLCINGFEAMILTVNFNIKIAYQSGYALIIMFDILYLCWTTNKISGKCKEVGNAFYSLPWYKLDIDIQKDICFIILRSQKPPRITSGNFVELNLRTAMEVLKNIYGWLALFRQVALK